MSQNRFFHQNSSNLVVDTPKEHKRNEKTILPSKTPPSRPLLRTENPKNAFLALYSAGIAIRIVSFLSHANVFCQTYSHFIHFGAKTSHFTFYLAAIHSG